MDKLRKIFLMAIIGLIFPCLSFAVPDFYYYDNFLTGQSPFSVTSSFEMTEIGTWEQYNPIQPYQGVVTSFSKEHMQGSSPSSAVPAYDLDLFIGRNMVLQPGEAIVIYSSSGSYSDTYCMLSREVPCLPLGTTRATNFPVTTSSFGTNAIYSSTDGSLLQLRYNWTSTPSSKYLRFMLTSSLYMKCNDTSINGNEFSPYQYSMVYLVFNTLDVPVSIYYRNYGGEDISVAGIPYNNISWIAWSSTSLSASSKGSSDVVSGNYLYILPKIKGDLDIYSYVHLTLDTSDSYRYVFNFDFSVNFDFANPTFLSNTQRYYPVSFSISGVNNVLKNLCIISLTDLPVVDGLAPIFLHQLNATPYIYNKAIYVYDGYMNINNYEELVALLKENGVGSSDMSRVEALLDEINTGGATGAEVKELIGILEQYHDQLMANGDFDSVASVFDIYKNLLDFSDDMHWLITANNALFSYFAGFLMLCVLFLAINRVMR